MEIGGVAIIVVVNIVIALMRVLGCIDIEDAIAQDTDKEQDAFVSSEKIN